MGRRARLPPEIKPSQQHKEEEQQQQEDGGRGRREKGEGEEQEEEKAPSEEETPAAPPTISNRRSIRESNEIYCHRIMRWGKFEPGDEEESHKSPDRRRGKTTVLHKHSSKKKKSSITDSIITTTTTTATTIISTSSSGIETDSVDTSANPGSSNTSSSYGVRAFLFLIILLQVTQFSVAWSWLLPLSAYCLETNPNRALMSSIGYLEYLLQQGCDWAIPASNLRLGGREEFREEREKMRLGFEDLETELWGRLPEEIMEKILAKLPLKNVMQICLLSKSYREKLSTPAFKAEVCRNSVNAKSLCPLHYSHTSLKVQGFDCSVREWQELLSLTYLPERIRNDCSLIKFQPIAHNDTNRSFQSVAGSLLCFLQVDSEPSSNLIIHVTNPLNRTLREVPPIVRVRPHRLYTVKIFPVGFDGYCVIVLELDTMRAEQVSSDSEHTRLG
ncbi:hypothetical protein R1flu_020039 [Riccia fluitans]|uniref:F-box domain-containing protein n=1 Tax=Riccia fluitans TaxID=41844 RepID=A0ABD1ZM06_9MARC